MNTINPVQFKNSDPGSREQHVDLPVNNVSKNYRHEQGQSRLSQQAILSRLLNGNPPGTWYAQKVYPYWQQYS